MTEKLEGTPLPQESSKGGKRVEIPSANWPVAITDAIKEASEPIVLVVNTEVEKRIALRAAEDMDKKDLITVEIKEAK